MAALPPSSLLLLALLAAAAPWLLVRSPRGPDRRETAALLGGLALWAAGLAVLEASRTACWVLVACGLALLGAAGWPGAPRRAAAAFGAAGVAAGVLLEATPGRAGLLLYVGFAAPLLLAVALALVAARWLRWDPRPASLALLGVATLAPASAAMFDFLASYELYHAPVLLLALAAVGDRVARGRARSARARDAARRAPSMADALAAPEPLARRALACAAGAAAAAVLATLAAVAAGGTAWLAAALAAGAGACALLAARRRRPLAAALAAGLALVQGLDVAASAGIVRHVLGHAGPAAQVVLAAGTAAATLGAASLALAIAAWRDARAREALAAQRAGVLAPAAVATEGLPRDVLVVPAAEAPEPDALASFAARVAREGKPRGVLLVRAPPAEPLWSLSEAAYGWLLAQEEGPRIHVAIEEAGLVHFVPPVLAGEDA